MYIQTVKSKCLEISHCRLEDHFFKLTRKPELYSLDSSFLLTDQSPFLSESDYFLDFMPLFMQHRGEDHERILQLMVFKPVTSRFGVLLSTPRPSCLSELYAHSAHSQFSYTGNAFFIIT